MARPRRIMTDNPTPVISIQTTSAVEEDNDDVHFNKEVVVVTDSTKPKYEKVRFVNNRDPGRPLDFFYSSATHPLKSYKLMHDKEYDLPIEVINHLEGMNPNDPYSCHAFNYEDKFDEKSGMTKSMVSGYRSLYQCKSVRGR